MNIDVCMCTCMFSCGVVGWLFSQLFHEDYGIILACFALISRVIIVPQKASHLSTYYLAFSCHEA